MIWSLLLVNPELGSTTLLEKDNSHHLYEDGEIESWSLGLSPAILRTCRQICFEASEVLYGSNTFVFAILRRSMGHSHILNGAYRDCRFPRYFDVSIVPCFMHIKHWKVTMNLELYMLDRTAARGFVDFCLSIRESEVESLEVNVVSPGAARDHLVPACMAKALKPLEFVRNLTRLEVREVNPDTGDITLLSQYDKYVDEPGIPDATKQSALGPLVGLKLLTQGDSAVFQIFSAEEQLMVYAKAFERNEEQQAAMELKYHEALLRIDTDHWAFDSIIDLPELMFRHPVEEGLAKTVIASGRFDADAFREARASVLEFLEPQYKRMSGAALTVANFIKPFKIKGQGFGEDENATKDMCLKAWDMVNYYANSFVRDMPEAIQTYIDLHPKEFKKIFGSTYREKFLLKMHKGVKCLSTLVDRKRFMRMVRIVLEDMDQQYLTIRNARLALFDHDPTDPGCDIDLELCREYEEFDRPVLGPHISLVSPAVVLVPPLPRRAIDRLNTTLNNRACTHGGQCMKCIKERLVKDKTLSHASGKAKVKGAKGKDIKDDTLADIGGKVKARIVEDTEGNEDDANKDDDISQIIPSPRNGAIIPIFQK